jgi:hypothetical protein
MKLVVPLAILALTASPLLSQSIRYEVPEKKWDSNLGTHRAVVRVDAPAEAAHVALEWRRRDPAPAGKGVVVVDAATGNRINNAIAANITADAGDVTFQTVNGAGEYYVYFMPGNPGGGSFPKSKYLPPQDTATAEWKNAAGKRVEAKVVRWEARTEHDRFSEMEIIATQKEREAWLNAQQDPFFIFVEPAERPVRMFDHVPQRWLTTRSETELTAGTGEPLVFQLGLWAARGELKNVRVKFGPFTENGGGGTISTDRFRCFQPGGRSFDGKLFERSINVSSGSVLPLWCGVELDGTTAGRYVGTAEISAEGISRRIVPIMIRVTPDGDKARAYADPSRLAKLFWLDSAIAQDDKVTKGFTPLRVEGRTIHCLGRSLKVGEDGLPAAITSNFHPGVTRIVPQGREVLAEPMRFVVELADGTRVPLRASRFRFEKANEGVVEWTSELRGGDLELAVRGRMEFDGHVELRCALKSAKPVDLRDVKLEIPRTSDTAKYAIGLGLYGGAAPRTLDWKWNVSKHQDALWLGDVNAGLRVQLRAENYARPMVNIHYRRQPLNDPPSWSGNGKGGVKWDAQEGAVSNFTAYSGARSLTPGQPLHFDFDLSITPFKPLNTAAQWKDRYYHIGGVPAAPEKVIEAGANVVNIHQGNSLNPYINYPFLTAGKLGEYADRAHKAGLRVKHYYTVRELTNWTPELFALRAFGDELLAPGKGGGHAWCEEHLGANYWGAWYEPGVNDASILTTPMSRFHNFYLEGLRWLMDHAGCDGIYLDDVSYDRTVMKRARKLLDTDPRGGLIDLHSWNELNGMAGHASCALVFMDSFPFVDRLWFGEGHHYSEAAEQTLVAISGIPYGMMGEMLEGGGNPWLGLTFGMTGRLGWFGSPQPVWKLWDEFGVSDSEFIGWWDTTSPVKAKAPEVKATLWKKAGRSLVALGNFGDKPARAEIVIDWKALGLDPAKAALYAPAVSNFQPAALFRPGDKIPLAPKRGIALWLDETPHEAPAAIDTLALSKRPLLFEDRFVPKAAGDWSVTASPKAESPKSDGEGQVFLAPANAHAWMSRRLPDGTRVVTAQIRQDAADTAQQWGPGIAVIWSDGGFVKVNTRADGRFHISLNGAERLAGLCDRELPVTLAVVIDDKSVRIVALGEGAFQQEQELARVPIKDLTGKPVELRIGKMPNSLKPADNGDIGLKGWSRCDWVRVLGG